MAVACRGKEINESEIYKFPIDPIKENGDELWKYGIFFFYASRAWDTSIFNFTFERQRRGRLDISRKNVQSFFSSLFPVDRREREGRGEEVALTKQDEKEETRF